MSIQDAKLFMKKLADDPEFAGRFAQAEGMEAKMRVAAESGLSFTPEEARQVAEEMTDAELGKVAGGLVDPGYLAYFR